MPTPLGKQERTGIIRRFAERLSFPKLFFLLSGLFLLDFIVTDPIPFIDEAILGILAVILGMWKKRREEKERPIKNVTPNAGAADSPDR